MVVFVRDARADMHGTPIRPYRVDVQPGRLDRHCPFLRLLPDRERIPIAPICECARVGQVVR